jgi:hypothetical protein
MCKEMPVPSTNFIHFFQASKKLELEVDTLRREREVLITRISDLESENAHTHGRVSQLEGELHRLAFNPASSSGGGGGGGGGPDSKKAVIEKKETADTAAGIIHSVHIRTGGGDEGIRRTTRSVSQGDLSAAPVTLRPAGSGVNIEIKNGELVKSRSQELLLQVTPQLTAQQQPPARNLSGQQRYSQPLLAPAVSVVNLRHPAGVLENLLPHQHNKSQSHNELNAGQNRYKNLKIVTCQSR